MKETKRMHARLISVLDLIKDKYLSMRTQPRPVSIFNPAQYCVHVFGFCMRQVIIQLCVSLLVSISRFFPQSSR